MANRSNAGKDYWLKNVESLARDGRLVLLGLLSGGNFPEGASISQILYKRLQVKGSTLRSRSPQYQADLARRFREQFLDKLAGEKAGGSGLQVFVHKVCRLLWATRSFSTLCLDEQVFPWTKIQDAHREMESNRNSGKIIVEVV